MRSIKVMATLYFGLLLMSLMDTCLADPVVWLDDNVTLAGRDIYYVSTVQNETGKTFSSDITAFLTSEITQSLKREGMTVLDNQDAPRGSITIDSRLIDYEAGSAAKRWLLPGAGTTLCVIRSILVDDKSGKTIGEIVVSSSVSAGGLFSIGAENSVPKDVAQEIAKKISELVKKK